MKRKKSIVSYFIFAFYIWNNLVDNKPAVVGGVGTKPIGPVISQSPKKTPRPISQIDVRFCLVWFFLCQTQNYWDFIKEELWFIINQINVYRQLSTST